MAIALIGNFPLMPFNGNLGQNLFTVVVTALVLNALSNLPLASAATPIEKEVCELICSPLPGNSKDTPEKVCQEICKQGGTITRMREYVQGKIGPWIKPVEKIFPFLDCTVICSPTYGTGKVLLEGGTALYKKDIKNLGLTAAKGGCTALLVGDLIYPGSGTAACYSCCAALKGTGVI